MNPSPVPDAQLNISTGSINDIPSTRHHSVPQSMVASTGQPPPFLKQLSAPSGGIGGSAASDLLPGGRVQLDPLHGKHWDSGKNMIGLGDVQIPVIKQGSLYKTRFVIFFLIIITTLYKDSNKYKKKSFT